MKEVRDRLQLIVNEIDAELGNPGSIKVKVVGAATLRVRDNPMGSTIGYLSEGQIISLQKEQPNLSSQAKYNLAGDKRGLYGEWAAIDFNGKIGYCGSWYLQGTKAGSSPGPSPEPEPPKPTELPTDNYSKLGFHVNMAHGGLGSVERARVRFMAMNVNSPEAMNWALTMLERNPQLQMVLYRDTARVANVGPPPGNITPGLAGSNWYRDNSFWINPFKPYADRVYFEAYNEVPADFLDNWIAYFELSRIPIMESVGFRCSVGNFSVGVPDVKDIDGEFVRVLRKIRDGGHVLNFHEYGAPDFSAGQPWFVGRAKRLLRDYFTPIGLGDIKICFSEIGLDYSSNLPGSVRGWKKSNLGPSGYLNWLKLFDDYMRSMPNAIGGAIFLWGAVNSEHWKDFEVGDVPEMIGPLLKYISDNNGGSF